MVPKEIEIDAIRIQVDVRYEEEDMPNDFPFRRGDIWDVTVNLDTGEIQGWPKGKEAKLYMKVTDCGCYHLMSHGAIVAERNEEYVPHGVVPGEYGDYIDFKINGDGIITNWPKRPNLSVFFGDEDDE